MGLVNNKGQSFYSGLFLWQIDIYMYMQYTIGPTVSGRVLIDFCILLGEVLSKPPRESGRHFCVLYYE
jgi:hypothetical protein